MKRLATLLIALAIAATPLALAPGAQAQVSQIDVQMANAAIMNAGSRAARVPGIKKVPSVGVIRLDFWGDAIFMSDIPTASEYRIMVKKNAAGVAKMRRALSANPVTRAAIAKRGIAIGQIGGAQISTNGSLRLYIFDR